MRYQEWIFVTLLALAAVFPASGQQAAQPPNLVPNGSFENTKLTWVNTNCNYMALLAGATAIPKWTVTPDTVHEIVWAMTPTCDGFTAAAGKFFVDLSGFGGDSPNGAATQTIKKKFVAGQQYTFSLAVVGAVPLVTIDGAPISLTAGTPFKKGTTIWTPETGTFTAQSVNAVLTIRNPQPGLQVVFIDKVAIRAR